MQPNCSMKADRKPSRYGRSHTQSACPITRRTSTLKISALCWRPSPHRYRLLFNDPEIGQGRGELETEALATFEAVVRLIKAGQKEGELKRGDASQFTALLYGSLHGLADLRLSGRTRSAKGMDNIGVLPLILLDLLKK